jgi:hypothetical protein
VILTVVVVVHRVDAASAASVGDIVGDILFPIEPVADIVQHRLTHVDTLTTTWSHGCVDNNLNPPGWTVIAEKVGCDPHNRSADNAYQQCDPDRNQDPLQANVFEKNIRICLLRRSVGCRRYRTMT